MAKQRIPYAGETIRVIARFDDYNGAAIDVGSGATVTVDVFDDQDAKVVDGEAMAWDATGNDDGPYWYFRWATEGETPGKFQSQATCVVGEDISFEYGTITLKAKKVVEA